MSKKCGRRKPPRTRARSVRLPSDLAAMLALVETPEPRRSADIDWLRSRVAYEVECAATLGRAMRRLTCGS